MSEKLGPNLLAGLVGLVLLASSGSVDPAKPSSKSKRAESQGAQSLAEAPWASSIVALLAHHSSNLDVLLGENSQAAPEKIEAEAWVPQFDGGQVVLATVADPLDSHLPHLFDEQLGSLLRAAQSSGYALKSWTLPWSRKASTRSPPDLGAGGAGSTGECWTAKNPPIGKLLELCMKKPNAAHMIFAGIAERDSQFDRGHPG